MYFLQFKQQAINFSWGELSDLDSKEPRTDLLELGLEDFPTLTPAC